MKKILSEILAVTLTASLFTALPAGAEDAPLVNLGVVESEDFEGFEAESFTNTGYHLDGKVWLPKLASGDSASIVEEEDGNKALEIRRPLENVKSGASRFVYVFDEAYTGKVEISFDYRIINNNGSCPYFMTPGSSNSQGASGEVKGLIAANYWYTKNRPENWGNTSQLGTDWVPMTMTIDLINGKFDGVTYRYYGKSGETRRNISWDFSTAECADIKYFCIAEINYNQGDMVKEITADAVYRIDNIKVTHYDYPTISVDSRHEESVLEENEPVEISFNEKLSEASLTEGLFVLKQDGVSVPGYTVTADNTGKIISVIPENGWEFGKDYTLTVKKEIGAERGKVKPMNEDFTVTFSVEEIIGELNIEEGERFNGKVTPAMDGIDGVSYSYELKLNNGEFKAYSLSEIDEIGDYSLKIIAEKNGKTQEKTISFTVIGKVAPLAESVSVSDEVLLDSVIEGKYTFRDENGDAEGVSEYRWLLAESIDGEFLPVSGKTEKTIKVTEDFIDKYVVFEVTPVSKEEPYKGETVKSLPVKGMFRPTAKDVSLEKDGSTLKVKYTPFDENGDELDAYAVEWYYQTEKDGEYKAIKDATGEEYTIKETDVNMFISALIKPYSKSYPKEGTPVRTEAVETNFTPIATELKIIGTLTPGQTIGVEYSYHDENGDPEGDSLIEWYADGVKVGEGSSLRLTSAHSGKQIYFTVTPASNNSSVYGEIAKSGIVTVSKSSGVSSGGSGGGTSYVPAPAVKEEPKKEPVVNNNPSTVTEGFADIAGHWAKAEILELNKMGIINGVSENSFNPEGKLTRAQIAVILSRALGLDKGEVEFLDVAADAWFYEGVSACGAAGLIKGSDGLFRPDDYITREELAVIIARAIGEENIEYTAEELTFADKSEISGWAVNGIAFVSQKGIIKGMEDGSFKPKATATRAQAAVIIKGMLNASGGGDDE